MKNFKKIIGTVGLAALTLMSLASCTDDNDWTVDEQYDRLFHSTSFSVSPLDDRAAISFTKMPNTDFYVVEYSTDSLYDDIPMGGTEHSVVDSSFTSSPDTIYNLEGSTKYWIRIKSRNTSGKGSTWKYLDDYSFTTKAEQIITAVTPYSRTAEVTFTKGKALTQARVYKDGDSIVQDITKEEIAAGALTLKNLTPNSSYTLKLWNGNNVRGTYKFKTTEAYPDGYSVITLQEGDDLNTVLANATSDKVVIVFPQGMNYVMPNNEEKNPKTPVIPANIKSVVFWGAAGDSKPTFHAVGMNLEANTLDVVRFYNLNLVNESSSDKYIMNITNPVNINQLQMEKCNISNTRGVIRFQLLTAACTVSEVDFTNDVFTNIGSYGIFNAKGQKLLSTSKINVTDCTLNNVATAQSAVLNTNQAGCAVTFDHCTIYNIIMAGKSIVDVNKLKDVSVAFNSCLIGYINGYADGATIKACSEKGQATASNTYITKDMGWSSGCEAGDQIEYTSAELWKNPSNGDFTIQDLLQSKYASLGDPRWIVQ
ncbi:DUF5123 domain-containing protein [Prevotella sp. AGR2160]|uniref:DUF5123 domain-containing protein n=1 Tax=Prevotella sp. AGR2160 TaxID=1280674 RepID=UPI00041B4C7F|nr:DUF5123 domain-containing protein [Prevotella sp. AGR2160]